MKIEDYCQGDTFQVEKRTIFSTEWLPLCAEGQVGKAGDFLAVSVGGWGVVAARDAAGEVRVLRNACRHQNMQVVGTPSGNCANFRCRFHGWTYDLAGKFLSAPPLVAPPASQTDLDLAVLASTKAEGLLFFSMGQPPQPLRFGAALPPYSRTEIVDIDCNWKVAVEHLLAEGDRFLWPLMFVRQTGDGAVVRQIVPHTFLRTRLFSHSFGAAGSDAGIKTACEALQAERAAGTMPGDNDFHSRLTEAYAGSS